MTIEENGRDAAIALGMDPNVTYEMYFSKENGVVTFFFTTLPGAAHAHFSMSEDDVPAYRVL